MHVNSRIVKMGVQSNMFLRTNSKVRLKLRVTTYVWLCFVVICANMCPVTHGSGDDVVTFNVDEEYHTVTQSIPQQLTQLQGGRVSDRTVRLTKEKSPYLLREDLIIEPSGELVVDPDVEIRFSPMVGLTVKGVLSAKVSYDFELVYT
ncbi:hypothetical protein R5R35_006866 [Gryllus longicercus]|uniref:Uncharacterized protein n=1 Tax=Gryllus longicercus TaxID=2509291 RepID=A0AAN9Z775_9ORTH